MSPFLLPELRKYYPTFSQEALELGSTLIKHRSCQAKDIILEAGQVCDDLVFATASIIRCYYLTEEGAEHTLWMKPEKTFLTEYKSFVHRTPSQFSLQCYEDTELYSISRADLQTLYEKSTEWAQFGIRLTEEVHITLIDVFVNLLANDATRNYQYIEYAFPRFLQVAPLKDIASMLQISPVSLSRIRAGKQTK